MKRLYTLAVRGKSGEYRFEVLVDPQYVDEWRADGLEIDEVGNVIPFALAGRGVSRVVMFVQDVFHWRNPFRRPRA